LQIAWAQKANHRVSSVRSVDCERPQVWNSADTCIDNWQITTHGEACRSIIMSNMEFILQSLPLFLVGSQQKQIIPVTKLLVNPN
jgi:hypothetical protein